MPFGLADPNNLVRSRRAQLRRGVGYHQTEIDRVSLSEQRVHLTGDRTLSYDAL